MHIPTHLATFDFFFKLLNHPIVLSMFISTSFTNWIEPVSLGYFTFLAMTAFVFVLPLACP
jgi:hypothetical protein